MTVIRRNKCKVANKVSYDAQVRITINMKTGPLNKIHEMIQKMNINLTLTICGAAASAGIPRQQSRATSAGRESQTPSLQITSRPPAVDS